MDDNLNRIGFRLQVRPELLDEYRAHHADVWPEMRDALHRCGWHNYSLFLDADGTLFGYFETPGTLADAVAAMQASRSTSAGRREMAPYFVTGETPADQQMRPLDEVFHLP